MKTVEFDLDGDEFAFYDELTHYVEDQSIRASAEDIARGRAIGFTMAMLQRRMASTIYAVRRTLERMRERREKILADPEAYRKQQIEQRVPDDFDELPEEEQQEIIAGLEDVVASVDPAALRAEITSLDQADRPGPHSRKARDRVEAHQAQERAQGPRLLLRSRRRSSCSSPSTKTRSTSSSAMEKTAGRYGKLREWGLTVTQIHGGMKIGDRDTPGTRIYSEREFRESAQVLVATEAAGEGINLQFCSQMINYDIPWNPVRLEQRVGRIHRPAQGKPSRSHPMHSPSPTGSGSNSFSSRRHSCRGLPSTPGSEPSRSRKSRGTLKSASTP